MLHAFDSSPVTSLDGIAAGLTGITLLTIYFVAFSSRAGLFKSWHVFDSFITADDIAAGKAEELADKAKLAVLAGEDKTVPPQAEIQAEATESTPLLKLATPSKRRSKSNVIFIAIGCIELVAHITIFTLSTLQVARGRASLGSLASPIIFVLVWIHATFTPLTQPSTTVPYDLLALYIVSGLASISAFYTGYSGSTSTPLGLALQVGNMLLLAAGFLTLFLMPMQDSGPPTMEDGLHPAMDDHVTLFGWLTFNWMSPLISIGTTRAMEDLDVWQLSQLLRSRILMTKFRHFKRKSLIWRILMANSLDLFLDFALTIFSASLGIAQPFLLNLTLRALEEDQASISSYPMGNLAMSISSSFRALPTSWYSYTASTIGMPQSMSKDVSVSTTSEHRQMAYFYAALAFLCLLTKSQTDLQHLYYSRRAAVRAQSELVGSIYEKALVRKDITGAVASDLLAKTKEKKTKDDSDKKPTDDKEKPVASADVGKIVSLIATDASSCANLMSFVTRLYEVPVNIIGACYLLYSLMGWSAFFGYAVFLIAMPINFFIMSELFKLRKTLLDVRDKRMREMNQAIQAIKFIKFFAWESRWVDRIMDARAREMRWLRKSKLYNFALNFFWDVVPMLVSLISFSSFVLISKGQLTVAIAFPALQIFGILTQSLTMIPLMGQFLIQTYASVLRIGTYLDEEEIPERVSWQSEIRTGAFDPNAPFDERIGYEDATFRWTNPNSADDTSKPKEKKDPLFTRFKRVFSRKASPAVIDEEQAGPEDEPEEEFELRNVDVLFKRGGMNLISGPTGSGKSSLLSALLGEMNLVSGQVFLPKNPAKIDPITGLREDVSYCAQQPWLQHQSIRDNIIFGLVYDEKRYNDVLKACALATDLALLEDGDQTEIGEKGVSLSGGQKARVALARAVYARSKTVILDDVLSAVDSHTAENLINDCLRGPLLANRTVILVTHHVDLVIDACAWVVQLENGIIAAQGTPDDLRQRGLLSSIRQAAQKAEEAIEPLAADEAIDSSEVTPTNGTATKGEPTRKLVDKEEKAEGRVQLKIYLVYISASSYVLFAIGTLLILLQAVGDMSLKFWARFWGESYLRDDSDDSPWPHFPPPQKNVLPYLGGYALIQVITAILLIGSQVPAIFSSLRASRKLYRSMLMSVIRAPSRWFDKTPSGRILNRFSKDIDVIDSGLKSYIDVVLYSGIAAVVSIITVIWGTPMFFFPLIAIGALQYWFTLGYVSVSRDLRRIESNTRSPIISSFSELINGISTVRAFGAERFFVNSLFKRLDRTQAANYYYWMCNRWLLFRFDFLGSLVVLSATFISINRGISVGLAGIVISQAQNLIMNFYWMLRFYTEMEQALNSVERVHEYMDVPSEPPSIIEGSRPPADWPSSSGGVSVEKLVMKYSPELEPVLHNVSFEIKPREKIGLVGRTGSGKSTLALAFFRFVDPDEGKIIIDGVDITSIGLEDLRSRLTIIPQDAVLFAGTIKENLDPFNEHSDEDCLDALRRVQLRTSVSPQSTAVSSRTNSRPGTPNGESSIDGGDDSASSTLSPSERGTKTVITLETPVSESGNNFSSGQRQLIAMARALLRRSRFVVMDESTASVDFATDLKIQEAIREEFQDSILITIAHRLRTVIDYDRILVLDAGKVAEFDTPKNLIAKEDGIFRSMCVKSGDFDELKEAADRRAAWHLS